MKKEDKIMMMKKEDKIISIFGDSEKETPKKMISTIKKRRELFKEYEKKREEFKILEKEYIIFLNTEYETTIRPFIYFGD